VQESAKAPSALAVRGYSSLAVAEKERGDGREAADLRSVGGTIGTAE
jgi:hypothetical protein